MQVWRITLRVLILLVTIYGFHGRIYGRFFGHEDNFKSAQFIFDRHLFSCERNELNSRLILEYDAIHSLLRISELP